MKVTDEMVEAFANVYHFRGQTYSPDLVRAALEAAMSQPVAEAVDIELQCPSCKSVEPYRLQIGGDAPAGVTFRTFPAPAVAQPGAFQFNEELHATMKVVTSLSAKVKAVEALVDEMDKRSPTGNYFANKIRKALATTPRGTGEGA